MRGAAAKLTATTKVMTVTDALSKSFDSSVRRWKQRALPAMAGVTLHKKHLMPKFAGKAAMKKLCKALEVNLGLEFAADGTLVTVDPHVRLKAQVAKAYQDDLIEEGDVLRCPLSAAQCPCARNATTQSSVHTFTHFL